MKNKDVVKAMIVKIKNGIFYSGADAIVVFELLDLLDELIETIEELL